MKPLVACSVNNARQRQNVLRKQNEAKHLLLVRLLRLRHNQLRNRCGYAMFRWRVPMLRPEESVWLMITVVVVMDKSSDHERGRFSGAARGRNRSSTARPHRVPQKGRGRG